MDRLAGAMAGGAAGACAVVASAVTTLPSTGCNTHQCDVSCVALGGSPPADCSAYGDGGTVGHTHVEQGDWVWESNAEDEPWLDLSAQRKYVVTYPEPFACPPDLSLTQIAADANDPQNGWVAAGSGIVQFEGNVPDETGLYRGVTVTNLTCARYGVRIVARGTPISSQPAWCNSGAAATDGAGPVEAAPSTSNGNGTDASPPE